MVIMIIPVYASQIQMNRGKEKQVGRNKIILTIYPFSFKNTISRIIIKLILFLIDLQIRNNNNNN